MQIGPLFRSSWQGVLARFTYLLEMLDGPLHSTLQ